ncbi:MAG: flagellar biosynthesis protein FlhF [Gammaproteobacteria bacterium]
MKIKRFFAEDIRQAMRMVKEELGADAVIMSNRSVDGGVEIVAARDFDEQLIQQKLEQQAAAQRARDNTVKKPVLENFTGGDKPVHVVSSDRKIGADGSIPPRTVRRPADEYLGNAEKAQIKRTWKPEPDAELRHERAARPVPTKNYREPPAHQPQAAAIGNESAVSTQMQHDIGNDTLIREMFQELKALRSAIDGRFGDLNKPSRDAGDPVRSELLNRLTDMGMDRNVSLRLLQHLNAFDAVEPAFARLREILEDALPVADDKLLDYGGIAVLIGPTGVGKTTTIAKLAARFILKHGSGQVALITTDNFRIGAHEQLNTYGRILDVPVRAASNAEQLRRLVDGFDNKRLILIDSAGMGPRDRRLAEQIDTLQRHDLPIRPYLVMSAATQYKALEQVIDAFGIFRPEACILTKLDETASKGTALSALIERQLPLAFVTDGQQVPEDLHGASASALIRQCMAESERDIDYRTDFDFGDRMAHGYA